LPEPGVRAIDDLVGVEENDERVAASSSADALGEGARERLVGQDEDVVLV